LRESGRLINRDAFSPIAGPAFRMGDGEDADVFREIEVEDQVGKAGNNIFAGTSIFPSRKTERAFRDFSNAFASIALLNRTGVSGGACST
jgi:hypothetical protein